MAWQAPTFDVTGKTYMVDPAPVTQAIKDSGSIQRDVLRGLASTVKVQSDIMARRQLAEMNASIANIDPTSPTYYQDRANILASNQMAFENPKTANTAKAILGGLDTAFATNARQQEMRLRSDLDLERLDVSDRYQRGRMSFEEQLRSQRPQTGRSSLLGAAIGRPSAAPVETAAPDISSLGLEDPDLPENPSGGNPDASLLDLGPMPPDSQAADDEFDEILNPGDKVPVPPAPVTPAAPPQGQGIFQQPMQVEGLAPVGSGEAMVPAVTEWEFEDIATPKGKAEVAAVQDLGDMPGASKAAKLRSLSYALNREQSGADPGIVMEAQRQIAELEVDPDVRAFEAAKIADVKRRAKAIEDEQNSGPKDTSADRRAAVERAVNYEISGELGKEDALESEIKFLRDQGKKKDAPADIGAQIAAKNAELIALKSRNIQAKSVLESQWDTLIRQDPEAFQKRLDAQKQEALAAAETAQDAQFNSTYGLPDEYDVDLPVQTPASRAAAQRGFDAIVPPTMNADGTPAPMPSSRDYAQNNDSSAEATPAATGIGLFPSGAPEVRAAKSNEWWTARKTDVAPLLENATVEELQAIAANAPVPFQSGSTERVPAARKIATSAKLIGKSVPGGDDDNNTGKSANPMNTSWEEVIQSAAQDLLRKRNAAPSSSGRLTIKEITAKPAS